MSDDERREEKVREGRRGEETARDLSPSSEPARSTRLARVTLSVLLLGCATYRHVARSTRSSL